MPLGWWPRLRSCKKGQNVNRTWADPMPNIERIVFLLPSCGLNSVYRFRNTVTMKNSPCVYCFANWRELWSSTTAPLSPQNNRIVARNRTIVSLFGIVYCVANNRIVARNRILFCELTEPVVVYNSSHQFPKQYTNPCRRCTAESWTSVLKLVVLMSMWNQQVLLGGERGGGMGSRALRSKLALHYTLL